ncbi:hypothetical protein EDD36DRAFT_421374 [Exophiala viscosa]|uniref:Uncharacterized protein n=1 Tax=Exophiala viscosa TaxID=2486360 RepID=A0AAN6DPP5_9EURO|nr:hypothetical protein EDD36DRAFT_421374 [Exophiala viscosa]
MCFRGRVKKFCMQCTDDVGATDPRHLPIETVRCHAYMYGDRSRCPGVIGTDRTLSTDEGIICQRCRETIVRNAERAGRENREREAGVTANKMLIDPQRIDQAAPMERMVIIDRMATTDGTAVEAPVAATMGEVVPTAIRPTEQTVIMGQTGRTVITDRMDRATTDTTAIIEGCGRSYPRLEVVTDATIEGCSLVDGRELCSAR